MKTYCSPKPAVALSLIGASLTLIASAGTSPTLTEQFNTADADVSGFLSETEFASLYEPALKKGKLKKALRNADDDGDKEISLEEWLAFRSAEILKNPKKSPEQAFEVSDLDLSGSLDLFEFAPLIPGKKPLIQKRKSFLKADADDDDLVTLERAAGEFAAVMGADILDRKIFAVDVEHHDRGTVNVRHLAGTRGDLADRRNLDPVRHAYFAMLIQ